MSSARSEAESLLRAMGLASPAEFRLYEAALACALHEDGQRSADAARRLPLEGAERIAAQLARGERPEDALCEALGGDLGLTGDLFTLDDPANADLIAVCARRRGLSLALGLVYLEAGRQAGLTLAGVDFPGHFLIRVETDEGPIALDPFAGGRVVMPSELSRRALATGLTPGVADRMEALMAPAPDRQLILRLQGLIFARAMRAGLWEAAERAAIRRALLDAADHHPWLDVAGAREAQGRLSGALEALERARALEGADASAARLRHDRVRLRLN